MTQHGVPIVRRHALARGLYATVEVGDEIRRSTTGHGKAELLAYVYRLAGPPGIQNGQWLMAKTGHAITVLLELAIGHSPFGIYD